MTQVGYVARTASGASYVSNSRGHLKCVLRWIRVEISQGLAPAEGAVLGLVADLKQSTTVRAGVENGHLDTLDALR